MSVATNPVTERAPRSPQQQLALGSLLGGLYVLASLWLVFAGLPLFWSEFLRVQDYTNEFLSSALLLVVCLLAAVGLSYLGYRLVKNQTRRGLRAGILFAAVLMFVSVWLAAALGQTLTAQEFEAPVGIAVDAVVLLALLGGTCFLFLLPGWRKVLEAVEDQGWFTLVPYKGNQGVRVRRATVLGVLVLGFSGIITMINHRTFGYERPELPPNDWYWTVPFSSQTVDLRKLFDQRGVSVDDLRSLVSGLGLGEAARAKLSEADLTVEGIRQLVGDRAGLVTVSKYVPLMFKIHIIMPLVLGLALLWFAYRVVNVPAFADFLIATEAEMNKVSWTTRRRLVQDTIVVLVTVVLMTVFLFVVDVLWIKILSNDWVRVLNVDIKEVQRKQQEKTQW